MEEKGWFVEMIKCVNDRRIFLVKIIKRHLKERKEYNLPSCTKTTL